MSESLFKISALFMIVAAIWFFTSGPLEAAKHSKSTTTKYSIVVYGTTTCPACKTLEAKLDSRGFKHKVINVDKSPKDAKKLRDMGLYTVPQMFVDGELIGGSSASNRWINTH